MIIRCARILGTDLAPVVDGWIRVEGQTILEVGRGTPPEPGIVVTGWLVPGFVDLHVHGGGGATFQSGDPAEAERAVGFHRRHGTTTMLASLVTAPVSELRAVGEGLQQSVEDGLLAGIHLEGPFLAAARCGAHDPALLRPPTAADLDALLTGVPVRMVTLAPELPGGIDAVRRVVAAGALAAVGHTAASYDVAAAAIDAGATVATHLFNAMPALHHREPGPTLALLEDERVTVELINDGVHVHPSLVQWVLRSAPGRVALVTDAVSAAGVGDGPFRLGSLDVEVRGGTPRLVHDGSLAGSTLTMDVAVAGAVRAGADPADAVAAATAVPARALGRTDIGRLAAGCRADLVALDDTFAVTSVWCAGAEVSGV